MRRIIREEEPPRPSTQITTLAAEAASTVGTMRKSDPRQLSRLFRGELDWIVMKCSGKRPHPPLRNGHAPGQRRGALPARRAGASLPAVGPVSIRQIRPAEQGGACDGGIGRGALVLGIVVSTWQAVRALTCGSAGEGQRAGR